MTVTLKLSEKLEARLIAEAEAKGVPVSQVVSDYLDRAVSGYDPRQVTADEMERGLDGIAHVLPADLPSLSDRAPSRDSIYTCEDDWNRKQMS